MEFAAVLFPVVSTLLPLVSQVNAEGSNVLFCHTCSPLTDESNCTQVSSNTLSSCTNWDNHEVIVDCFAAFLDYENAQLPDIGWERATNPSTGIYRGCAARHASIPDFCQFYREQVAPANISLVSCVTCAGHGCNSNTFHPNGQIAGGESLQKLQHSIVFVLIVCSLLIK